MLVCAPLTALLGIAHCAVQTRLERVVAYSSVENAGLICVGFAIALVGATTGDERLVAVGLLAGLLQAVAHAFAKSLLFVTTGAIELTTETTELDALRGIGRRLPWAGTGLGVGAVTLAGLPPTIGFASEWFLLEALMQQFRVGNLAMALGMAFAGALVALTAGFASVAFVRIVGLTVLGPIRHVPVPTSRLFGLGIPGRFAVILLGLGCLGIAAVTPLEIRVLAAGVSDIVPASVTLGALKSPWVVQPVYPDFSILSPSWLWVVMPAIFAALLLVATAASRGGLWRVRRTHPWLSATGGVEGVDQYTPFGYANPTRRVLANLLRTRTQVRPHAVAGGGEHDGAPHAGTSLGYSSDVVEVVEEYLYRPLGRPLRSIVAAAKRFQSGRIDAYLAYMLIALVAVIAIVVVVS
ncbi:MAG: proton-conducting transporter membrane subunit [Streptosporangiales bacterium]